MITLEDLSEPAPDPGPADWNEDGVLHLPGLLDPNMVAAYFDAWAASNGPVKLNPAHNIEADGGHWDATAGAADPSSLWVLDAREPGGWQDACPYMRHPALRDLCTDPRLADELERLVGTPMGVHLNLTGLVSTQRDWHQDGYLNPELVGDRYAAVWMALGDVHPDSGPFQFIPGSHRWHRLTRERIGQHVNLDDPAWPRRTEDFLTELVEAEIVERNAHVIDFIPSAGDVLIWHPRLYHRGTAPKVANAYRPALIAHYSAITVRPDMPTPERAPLGGWLFPIHTDQPVR